MRSRRGVTLVELIVALVILAVALTVVPVSLRAPEAPASDPVAELRREAVRSGQARTRAVRVADSTVVVTALPDGRIVGSGAHPLTGRRQ